MKPGNDKEAEEETSFLANKKSDKPLQSHYLEDRFGDSFSYIDNLMNHFYQKYQNQSLSEV